MDSLRSLVSGVYNLFISAPDQTVQFNQAIQAPPSPAMQGIQDYSASQTLINAVSKRDIQAVLNALLVNSMQIDLIINQKNKKGQTPLMIAARSGHRAITSILLSHGADHALENEDGFTALELAIYFGKTEVAKILLDNGASFDSAMLNNLLTMDEAYSTANTIFKLSLHQHCALDLNTALETAFTNQDIELIYLLKENGANPSLIHLPEDTLRVASKKGQLKQVQALLAIDFPVNNQECNYGNTALIWAIKSKHLNIAKLLIDNGADITLSNSKGETPFLLCAPNSYSSMKFLTLSHQLLDNMTLEQIQLLEQNPECSRMIPSYKKKTITDLQETALCLLTPSFFVPTEIKLHILNMMPYPKWCMQIMAHAQNTILSTFAEREQKKAPVMIFSSVYQPDVMEVDIEEKSAPKKKDRSILL